MQVYLLQYPAALTTLQDVVTNGPYALEKSFDRVWTGFKAYENGKETICAFQASANDGEPNGNNANYGERLNFPHSGSPFGCCGSHQPSQNLVNFFKTDAAGLPLAMSSPNNWNADSQDLRATVTASMNFDPRVDWTVGRDSVPYKDWGLHDSTWIRSISNGGTYSPKKNAPEKAAGAPSSVGWVNTQLNSDNFHILRFADVLLLLAEAEVETGDLASANTHVNMVRMRAAAKAQGPGTSAATIAVPINDPSITWAKYVISPYPAFADQASARLAVRTERRLELAMEGQRFWDLKRWGVMETTIAGYLDGVGGGAESTRRAYLPQRRAAHGASRELSDPDRASPAEHSGRSGAGSAEHRLVSTARGERGAGPIGPAPRSPLFTITGYNGLDPSLPAADISGAGGDISDQYRGIDRGVYPSSRTFSVGITASF